MNDERRMSETARGGHGERKLVIARQPSQIISMAALPIGVTVVLNSDSSSSEN